MVFVRTIVASRRIRRGRQAKRAAFAASAKRERRIKAEVDELTIYVNLILGVSTQNETAFGELIDQLSLRFPLAHIQAELRGIRFASALIQSMVGVLRSYLPKETGLLRRSLQYYLLKDAPPPTPFKGRVVIPYILTNAVLLVVHITAPYALYIVFETRGFELAVKRANLIVGRLFYAQYRVHILRSLAIKIAQVKARG